MDTWQIDEKSASNAQDSISHNPAALKKWPKYKASVTENPFWNHKHRRIRKLKYKSSYPEGSYRYRDDPLRVIYIPAKSSKIIYTLAAGTASDVGYKKRSRK